MEASVEVEAPVEVAAPPGVDAPVEKEVPVVSGRKNTEKVKPLPRLEDIRSGPQMTISTGLFPEVNQIRLGRLLARFRGQLRKKGPATTT